MARLDVQVRPVCACDLPERGDVDERPDERGRDDEPPWTCGGRTSLRTASTEIDDAEQRERDAVCLRREDLCAAEPECHPSRRWPQCEPAQRQTPSAERRGIDQHVRRIGEEREGVRDERERYLAGHEGAHEHERDGQRPDVRLCRERGDEWCSCATP